MLNFNIKKLHLPFYTSKIAVNIYSFMGNKKYYEKIFVCKFWQWEKADKIIRFSPDSRLFGR